MVALGSSLPSLVKDSDPASLMPPPCRGPRFLICKWRSIHETDCVPRGNTHNMTLLGYKEGWESFYSCAQEGDENGYEHIGLFVLSA